MDTETQGADTLVRWGGVLRTVASLTTVELEESRYRGTCDRFVTAKVNADRELSQRVHAAEQHGGELVGHRVWLEGYAKFHAAIRGEVWEVVTWSS